MVAQTPGRDPELERRIAAALRARAADVRPDPATWRKVEAGIARDRWFRVVLGGFALAAIVAFAVIAVPALIRGPARVALDAPALSTPPATPTPAATVTPAEQPTVPALPTVPAISTPTQQPTVPAFPTPLPASPQDRPTATTPTSLLTTDGSALLLTRVDGQEPLPLEPPVPVSAPISGIAVRPGSTVVDLEYAWRSEDEVATGPSPCHAVQWAQVVDGGGNPPGSLAPNTGQLTNRGVRCASRPVFSPDGVWLAWADRIGDDNFGVSHDVALHAVAWGPGGPVEGSEVTFGLPALDYYGEIQLVHWTWDEVRGETRRGALKLLVQTASRFEVFTLPVQQQGDGALAIPGDAAPLGSFNGGWVVGRIEAADLRVRYEYPEGDAGPGVAVAASLLRRDAPEAAPLLLPESLLAAGAGALWLTGNADLAVVGSHSGEAYLVRWDAQAAGWDEPERLAGDVRFAVPVGAAD